MDTVSRHILRCTKDEMDPTIRVHKIAHLIHLESKGSLLKCRLHLPTPKIAQISLTTGGGAVGLGSGDLSQGLFPTLNALLKAAEQFLGLFLTPRDLCLLGSTDGQGNSQEMGRRGGR